MRIERDDLTRPEVLALIDYHLRTAHENSPPNAVFALGVAGLQEPSVTLWTAWQDNALLGMGALKQLDADHGELKSMRTAPSALRRGVGWAMLTHLIAHARAQGFRRLSLETGTNDAFAPARAMYERAGFVPRDAFSGYVENDFSRFYTLDLTASAP